MGLDSVVPRHKISTGNFDPRFTVVSRHRYVICNYLGLDEYIPINGIRQCWYQYIQYPCVFPRVDDWSTDPRILGRHTNW